MHVFSANFADCCVEKAHHTTVCFRFFAFPSSKLCSKIRTQFLCGQVLNFQHTPCLPNVDEFVYKLYDMAASVNLDNCNMHSMRVEYNVYDFHINSFDNEKLQIIQLWMLESLLEQAIGRAKLLRSVYFLLF